jgi:hypothetical protein
MKDQDLNQEETKTQWFGGGEGSPLSNTGPIPAELLNSFDYVDSVPWSIRRADKRRERLVWTTVLIVSWVVSAVTLLRLLGVM